MIGELETALYRITQEALTNATKHGHATRIVIEIREDPTTVHLTVRDDGNGFDPNAQSDGFGLLGMRERAELLDGELQIERHPGERHRAERAHPRAASRSRLVQRDRLPGRLARHASRPRRAPHALPAAWCVCVKQWPWK